MQENLSEKQGRKQAEAIIIIQKIVKSKQKNKTQKNQK